jgi:predicted Zn-dependent protease with MMP-like domain
MDDALEFLEADDDIADAKLIKADALIHKGDVEAARRTVNSLPAGPFEHPHLDFLVGRAKFEVGDRTGAAAHIERCIERDARNSDAHYYHGLILEEQGARRDATVAFLRSRDADARAAMPPWSVPADQFEQSVQSAIVNVPEELRAMLDGALVVVGDLPGAEVVADGVDPRVAVLFDDLTVTNGEAKVGRVFIYQRNVERLVMRPADVEDEVQRSVERELVALKAQSSVETKVEGVTAIPT